MWWILDNHRPVSECTVCYSFALQNLIPAGSFFGSLGMAVDPVLLLQSNARFCVTIPIPLTISEFLLLPIIELCHQSLSCSCSSSSSPFSQLSGAVSCSSLLPDRLIASSSPKGFLSHTWHAALHDRNWIGSPELTCKGCLEASQATTRAASEIQVRSMRSQD